MGLLGALKVIGRGFDRAAIGPVLGVAPELAPEDITPDQKRLLRAALLSNIGRSLATMSPDILPRQMAVASAVGEQIAARKREQQIRAAIDSAQSPLEKARIAAQFGLDNVANVFLKIAEAEEKKNEPVGGIQTVMKDGQPAVGFGTRGGAFVQIPGVTPAERGVQMDVGNEVKLVNPLTGQSIATAPKAVSPDTQANIEATNTRQQNYLNWQREKWRDELSQQVRELQMRAQALALDVERLNLQRARMGVGQLPPATVGAQLVGADMLSGALADLHDVISRRGLSINPRDPYTAELRSKARFILNYMKDTFGYGALQPGEIKLLEAIAEDPTSLSSQLRGKQVVLASIDNARKQVEMMRRTIMQGYGVRITPNGYRVVNPYLDEEGDGGQVELRQTNPGQADFEYIPGRGLTSSQR